MFLLVGRREDARGHLVTLMQVSRLLGDDIFRDGIHTAHDARAAVDTTLGVDLRLAPEKPPSELSRAGIVEHSGRFAGGLINDLKRRLPFYGDDFKQGLNFSSVAATIFLFFACFSGDQFWERVTLWARDPALYPSTHYLRRAPARVVHLFTAVQFVCFTALYAVKVVAGLLFPIGIALLIPIRLFMNRMFDTRHLIVLDAEETPDEEIDREVE